MNLIMMIPFIIIFPILGIVAETASLLLAVKNVNQEVLAEVLEKSIEPRNWSMPCASKFCIT